MRKIISALGLLLLIAGLARAADDVFPTEYVHVTNIGGVDDSVPTSYAHVTNFGAFVGLAPIGNGADDTPQLQAAVNANKPILLSAGSFNVCGLLVGAQTIIHGTSGQGNGGGSFMIAPANCANGYTIKAGSAVTTSGAGSGYQVSDTINLQTTNVMTGGTSTQVKVSVIGVSVLPTVSAAGSGGTPGACVITGTTGTGGKATYNATISAGGNLTAVGSIATAGTYTVAPSNPDTVTGCSLSGASIAIPTSSFGVVTATNNRSGTYSTAPSSPISQTATSGSGSGATFTITYNATMLLPADSTTSTYNWDFQDFMMNGNAANQSAVVDLMHLDQHGSVSGQGNPTLARLKFRNATGSCLIQDFAVRGMLAEQIATYKCGQTTPDPAILAYGSDSVWSNLVVGYSYGHGIDFISSGSDITINGAYIWFSGQSTTNFNAIHCNGSTLLTLNGIRSQDSGGSGFQMTNCSNVQLIGSSDSDGGQAASTYFGLALAGATNGNYNVVCNNRSGGAGVTKNCVNLSSSPNNNIVNFVTTGQSSFAAGGTMTNNVIQSTAATTIAAPAFASTLTPSPIVSMVDGGYLFYPGVLTGPVTIAAPSMGGGNNFPSGAKFCMKLTQDGTGNRQVTMNGIYHGNPVISGTQAAGSWIYACYLYDQTNWNNTYFTQGAT